MSRRRAAAGNLAGLMGRALVPALLLASGCGGWEGELVEDGAEQEDSLVNGTLTTNPYAIRLSSGGRWCTGTLVGPRALLSSGHCLTTLRVGDYISVTRFKSSARGDPSVEYRATKIARNGTGSTGLLLIEVNSNVAAYTSVCQEIFQSGDIVSHYGAGSTDFADEATQHYDYSLRVATQAFGGVTPSLYGSAGHGSYGDSGGPYMYNNSVAAVHYGHSWSWFPLTGTSRSDIATNLQDGWVFKQGIQVAKRRCRPDRSLGWAYGNVSGGLLASAQGSGASIVIGSEFRQLGTIVLGGGATASGSARAAKGLCRISGVGNAIEFYDDDGDGCRRKVGTINVQGVRVTGTSRATASAGGYFSAVSARIRKLVFTGDARTGSLGDLLLVQ